VRGGQLNSDCASKLTSYLYKGDSMTDRDFRLVRGIICRKYFGQFAISSSEENDYLLIKEKQRKVFYCITNTSLTY
jgi:hypothetical protein